MKNHIHIHEGYDIYIDMETIPITPYIVVLYIFVILKGGEGSCGRFMYVWSKEAYTESKALSTSPTT